MNRHFAGLGSSIVVLALSSGARAEGASVAAAVSPAKISESSSGRPESNYFEVGIYGGVVMPSKQHNFQDEALPHQEFQTVAPEIGARVAYFPLAFLGLETEGMVAPTKTQDGRAAGLWAVRAHALGQLPMTGFTPFALIGVSRMGAGSNAMGSDSDPAVHFGVGAKLPVDDFLGLRFDVRDNLTQKNGASLGTQTHHPEILGGLTFTLDLRKKAAPPPPDGDADGFPDDKDKCPAEPGVAPDGCPPPPPDADQDGITDDEDACPEVAGPKNDDRAKNGCPPPKDSDGDGVLDPDDKCPAEAGVLPDGCPDPDPDHDGVLAPNDKCPDQPETKNGFQDDDGCPDEVPAEVAKFTGVIQGIEFDLGKAAIRAKSKPLLDDAVKVLKQYPTLRIEISGHTDDAGQREANIALSERRAAAVKDYLVSQGIDSSRVTTRGAGPDQPIADNKKPEGRQKNRRIEFKLLTE